MNYKDWAVNTAGFLILSNPIASAIERWGYGMTNEESIDARIWASIISIAAGEGFELGRHYFNKGIDRLTKPEERCQKTRDFFYSGLFSVAFTAGLYTFIGAKLEDIVTGSLVAPLIGAPMGITTGYSIDASRELTGLDEYDKADVKKKKRLPEKIRNLSKKTKLGIFGLAIAGSIAVMSGIYSLTPDSFKGIKGCIKDYVTNSQSYDVQEERK